MTRSLIDTSVWIEHLRSPVTDLEELLGRHQVLTHSAVIGELACGSIPKRGQFLADLHLLPKSQEANTDEVLRLLEKRNLYGKGLGWVDMQLLASALISDAALLTYDKRLGETFARLSRT